MKYEELKGKSTDELNKLLVELKKEVFNFRFQKSTGVIEKTHRIAEAKKEIARVNTYLSELKNKAA